MGEGLHGGCWLRCPILPLASQFISAPYLFHVDVSSKAGLVSQRSLAASYKGGNEKSGYMSAWDAMQHLQP